jgi:putative membrane protein
MQFLKGLIWFLLAVLIVVFAAANWITVPVRLWGGLVMEINLPLLMLVMFLIGWLPTFAYHHSVRWRLRKRLATSERTITDLRTATMAPAAAPLPRDPLDPAAPPAMPAGSA